MGEKKKEKEKKGGGGGGGGGVKLSNDCHDMYFVFFTHTVILIKLM